MAARRLAAPTRKSTRESTDSKANDPLLARVLDDPDDDALRAVWADALQEQADPRGELIAIQIAAQGKALTAAQDKRVRSLLAKHASEWLGPLADVIMRRAGLVFDRGVITSCQIQVKSLTALNTAVGHPLWATLRKIWFCDSFAWDPRTVALLAHPVFRSLRDVTCIGLNTIFAPLATHERPLPFTSIWCMDDTWRAQNPSAVRHGPAADAPSLPSLRRLGIASQEAAWIFDLPVVKRLETLGLTVRESTGECLAYAERTPKTLRVLELRPGWIMNQGLYRPHFVLKLTRDESDRFSRLSIDIGNYIGPFAPRLDLPTIPTKEHRESAARHASRAGGLAPDLASIPAKSIRKIDVHRIPDVPAMRKVLCRFEDAEITFVDDASSRSSPRV